MPLPVGSLIAGAVAEDDWLRATPPCQKGIERVAQGRYRQDIGKHGEDPARGKGLPFDERRFALVEHVEIETQQDCLAGLGVSLEEVAHLFRQGTAERDFLEA